MFHTHTHARRKSLFRWRRVCARHIVWKSYQGNAVHQGVLSRSHLRAGEHFE